MKPELRLERKRCSGCGSKYAPSYQDTQARTQAHHDPSHFIVTAVKAKGVLVRSVEESQIYTLTLARLKPVEGSRVPRVASLV